MRWAAARIPGISDGAAEPTTAIGTRREDQRAYLKDEPCSRPGTPHVVSPTRVAMQEWCLRVERESGVRWHYRRVNRSEFGQRCTTLAELVEGAHTPGMF